MTVELSPWFVLVLELCVSAVCVGFSVIVLTMCVYVVLALPKAYADEKDDAQS